MIEIRDVNASSVDRMDELALRTNELNESIQMIAQCRETLQVSKTGIERHLNQIMIQLMSCEYSLINKIKQINTTIMDVSHSSHSIDVDNIDESKETFDVVKTVIDMFSNTATEDDEAMLYQIYDIHGVDDGQTTQWSNATVNIPKRMWQLANNENSVYIRFMKTGMVAIFPNITDNMIEIVAELRKNKKLKNSSDGSVIKCDADNIAQILQLCECL